MKVLLKFSENKEKYDNTAGEYNVIEHKEGGIEHELYEGDNLALLNKLIEDNIKVDVIYIDPPYNTGNQFTYNDNRGTEEWLSFMYKRLKKAKEVLKEDGVIFVSIDDNMHAELKLLMDKVYDKENFIGNFIWEKNTAPPNLNKTIRSTTESIFVYSKGEIEFIESYKNDVMDTTLFNRVNRVKELIIPKEYVKTKLKDGLYMKAKHDNIELLKPVKVIGGKLTSDLHIKGSFRWTQETLNERLKNNNMHILINSNSFSLRIEGYGIERKIRPKSLLPTDKVGTTHQSNALMNKMKLQSFSYTKPVNLIKYLIKLIPNPDITVLDFFAGSGTTGHAVMQLNKEDNGNRKFILCTTNEINRRTAAEFFYSKGYIDKPHINKLNKFKKENPKKYNSIVKSKEYNDEGVFRKVLHPRINKVIEGYTTPKGKVIEGLNNNGYTYYKLKGDNS